MHIFSCAREVLEAHSKFEWEYGDYGKFDKNGQ